MFTIRHLKKEKKNMEDSLRESEFSYYFETKFDRRNLNEEDKNYNKYE